MNNSSSDLYHSKTNNTVFYCPHCEHCNQHKNEAFNSHIRAQAEAKTIINKGLEAFILATQKVSQNVDIFNDQFKAYEGGINVN